MYPDLYKGLSLRAEDLTPYSSPLVSFEGKVIIPKGQIRLPVQTSSETVEVDFIVVNAYFPYIAIVARPWLHTLGVVSSTLHQKIKYPSGGQIKEILGDQTLPQGTHALGASNRGAAVDYTLVIPGPVELEPGLDDVDRLQTRGLHDSAERA